MSEMLECLEQDTERMIVIPGGFGCRNECTAQFQSGNDTEV